MRKRHHLSLLPALIPLAFAGFLAACDDEGPMERAGEQADRAVEDVGDAVKDTGRAIERKAD